LRYATQPLSIHTKINFLLITNFVNDLESVRSPLASMSALLKKQAKI